MSKPIGYFCAVTPGDGSFLDHLQNKYGSQLEKLSKVEKLHILNALVINLIHAEPLQGNAETIRKLQIGIHERLPIDDHLSLIDAIVNQLKHQSFQR
ncbi:hypothetical protein HUN01_28615 [Nostoc edaphicum CCNP1411]|uniref:Uncharacterized protein n=1 Tax=Nostoc edaphicum CCNP1411 TaxID=1472755 RepID=A0A7D7LG54_9NOSO|nr:hypothetical protein [Nostoc edaphicum]QMS91368.1 hypothetical protein HUN01_28615 [Nostoc edaphicum CCNP1411]